MKEYDIVIIGGGSAGLAAAISAKEAGVESIIILERENQLGGILNQNIHNGFGIRTFKEEITGPEFAQRFVDKIVELKIPYKLNTMVLELDENKIITATNEEDGILIIKAKTVILAVGCREKAKGVLNIPRCSCAGIYSAGTAQKLVNIDGYMPGKEIIIVGLGKIGLTMARRMTLEGAKVKAVVEMKPYSYASKRDMAQCLEDFNIPLKLSHMIIDIKGNGRVEGVNITAVDEKGMPIEDTEEFVTCDTLLLCEGLVPDTELSKIAGIKLSDKNSGPEVDENFETNIEGIFACGNALYIHETVDNIVEESYKAGRCAAQHVIERK